MITSTQAIAAYLLNDLIRKLNPRRFPGMSPILSALIGFVLGADFFGPNIAAVTVTQSGTVVARINGDTSTRVLGNYPDLLRSWMRLISRVGLSQREFLEVQYLFAERVGFVGPTNA